MRDTQTIKRSAPQLYGVPALIAAVSLTPVFTVRYFTNNDGSGHLYISHLMRQLIAGNEFFSQYFVFNSFALPNSTGHWIIAVLLGFFSPEMVTKVMLTATFLAFFFAVLFLRRQVAGHDCPVLASLFAGLLSLNWFWFQGGYNQTLGAAGVAAGLALVFRWRDRLTPSKVTALAILVLLVYLSHLVSYAILCIGIILVVVFQNMRIAIRSFPYAVGAIIPSLPVVFLHLANGNRNGEPFVPHWRGLETWYDPVSWLRYLSQADPFALASRKSLPFFDIQLPAFAVFSPFSLIMTASLMIAAVTILNLRNNDQNRFGSRGGLLILCAVLMAAAAFGPGDFGLANGSVLRERFLLSGLTILVAIFDAGNYRLMRRISAVALALGILIQVGFLLEFAGYADRQTRDFLSAADFVKDDASLSSVIIAPIAEKFRCLPATQMSSFIGVNRNVIVWDNYELGHYLFPVITKSREDREFAYRLSSTSVFGPEDKFKTRDEKLAELGNLLTSDRDRIDQLIVLGSDPQVEAMIMQYYDIAGIGTEGKVRVLIRKAL